MREIAYSILDEIRTTIKAVDEGKLFILADEIMQARRVFLAGIGRSDQVARTFAMRLMHLGFCCHVARDVTTPAIGSGDLIIIFSSSPESRWLADIAKKAYQVSARIAVFSPLSTSPVVDLAHICITIPKANNGILQSGQSSGVNYEQTAQILSDTLILHLAAKANRPAESLIKNRSNLE